MYWITFRYADLAFNFTRDFLEKYKGNIGILVFCIFSHILFQSKSWDPPRSIRLINTVLQIPILPQYMTFYVIWHLSQNAIKWHFMTNAKCQERSSLVLYSKQAVRDALKKRVEFGNQSQHRWGGLTASPNKFVDYLGRSIGGWVGQVHISQNFATQ